MKISTPSSSFKGKNIVILGLGHSGLASVDFFVNQQAQVFVMDNRPLTIEPNPAVEYHFGQWRENWLNRADLIVVSPGISLATPAIAQAMAQGKKVVGDVEIFCQMTNKPILAITGSNGKSTVTSLVYAMAKCAGLKVAMGGNIGIPVLSLLNEDYDLFVLELSSFQLESTFSLRALGATVLNVSDDHLNRYDYSLEKYRKAKLRIYQNCQNLVINQDDKLTYPIEITQAQNAVYFSGMQNLANSGSYWLKSSPQGLILMVGDQEILPAQAMGISGKHNEINALSAIALAQTAQIPMPAIIQGLRTFQGLEHRFQKVNSAKGICWINDSKATNVGSTLSALESVEMIDGTLHLLLGGDGKGADFSPLEKYLQQENVRCYCFGQDGDKIARYARQSEIFATMEDAIIAIKSIATAGDMVLLSPACASLDQFKSFEQRGEIFTKLASI